MTRSALRHFAGSVLESGTMTTFIPAALADSIPLGASSNTNTCKQTENHILFYTGTGHKNHTFAGLLGGLLNLLAVTW